MRETSLAFSVGPGVPETVKTLADFVTWCKINPKLATTGAQCSKFVLDVPTMVDAGFKDVVAEVWLGVLMPANTPPVIVSKASTAINEALRSPELRDTYSKFGMDALQGTPESLTALIKSDLSMWGPVIKASGFTAEE